MCRDGARRAERAEQRPPRELVQRAQLLGWRALLQKRAGRMRPARELSRRRARAVVACPVEDGREHPRWRAELADWGQIADRAGVLLLLPAGDQLRVLQPLHRRLELSPRNVPVLIEVRRGHQVVDLALRHLRATAALSHMLPPPR